MNILWQTIAQEEEEEEEEETTTRKKALQTNQSVIPARGSESWARKCFISDCWRVGSVKCVFVCVLGGVCVHVCECVYVHMEAHECVLRCGGYSVYA